MVTDFEESFRASNLKAVKDTPVLPPDRARRAIATGVFEGGGKEYPCEKEAQEATNLLLNRIADTYQRIAGVALGWDAISLTGCLAFQPCLILLIYLVIETISIKCANWRKSDRQFALREVPGNECSYLNSYAPISYS